MGLLNSTVILFPHERDTPLVSAHHLRTHDSIPGGGFGVSVADEFRLRQHHQSNPHLCQACSRLRQSSPPPINNIPCHHPKSPATLWLRGRQIIVHVQHHACATPMAKRPKKAKNEFSGSCAVTNCTSGPAQPHHPVSEWGGSAPVGCSVIIVVSLVFGPPWWRASSVPC